MALALICLLFAGFNIPPRLIVHWGWMGMAFWCAAILWPAIAAYNILYVLAVLLVIVIVLLLLRPPRPLA